MTRVLADTHAFVWFLHRPERLSQAARDALRRAESSRDGIVVSAITVVELIYLVEKQRVDEQVLASLLNVLRDPAVPVDVAAIDAEVAASVALIPREAVPDMPDRVIAATALALDLPLVTGDRRLRAAGIETIW